MQCNSGSYMFRCVFLVMSRCPCSQDIGTEAAEQMYLEGLADVQNLLNVNPADEDARAVRLQGALAPTLLIRILIRPLPCYHCDESGFRCTGQTGAGSRTRSTACHTAEWLRQQASSCSHRASTASQNPASQRRERRAAWKAAQGWKPCM